MAPVMAAIHPLSGQNEPAAFRFSGTNACMILFQAPDVMKDTGHMRKKNHAPDFRPRVYSTVLHEEIAPASMATLRTWAIPWPTPFFPFPDEIKARNDKG